MIWSLLLALQDGYHPEEIEQLRTKTAYVLDMGELEFDLVVSFLRFDDRDETETILEIEYGLTGRLLIELEIPYLVVDPSPGSREHGIGDLELEAKYAIGEFYALCLALGAEISIPTGDED